MDFNISVYLQKNAIHNETDNTTDSDAIEEYDKNRETFFYSTAFLCSVLFVAVLCREYLKKLPFPYTVVLFLYGGILGVLDYNFESFRNFTRFAKNDIVMQLFLPVIIFDYSFEMNPHMFTMAIAQCLSLAVPGFILCSALASVYAKVVLTLYNWDWIVCVLFGTILTATDPSAAIETLKDYGVAGNLITILKGEAVLNSGMALVASKTIIKGFAAERLSYENIVLYIFQSCFGSVAFGYIISKVVIAIFRRADNDMDMEVTFTFCAAYIVYFVSELYLDVSGILAVVVLGVSISSYKSSMNYESDETTVHQFWQTLSFWADSLIFTGVGVLISSNAIANFDFSDIGFIVSSYFVICFFRSCTIALLTPLLKNCGYGFSWKSGVLVSWGGMRGTIGLALALLTRKTRSPDVMNKLLIQVSGVITLTLVFNASTMYSLLQFLGFGQITEKNIESMARTVALLRDAVQTTEKVLRMDRHFTRADWPWIKSVTYIENPYHEKGSVRSAMMKRAFETYRGRCKECNAEIRIEPIPEERKEMELESRSLVLRALKNTVANHHENYLILRRTLGHLNTCVEYAQDSQKCLLAEDVQKRFLVISSYIKYLNKCLMKVLYMLDVKERYSIKQQRFLEHDDANRFRGFCIKLYLSQRFKDLMYWILLLNIIPVVGEYISLFTKFRLLYENVHHGDEFLFFEVLNGFCALFYVWDAVVKIVSLRMKIYFRNWEYVIEFFVTVIAVLQLVYAIVVVSVFWKVYTIHHLYGFVGLTTIRILRLLKIILGGIFNIIVNEICSMFYNAFDLAMGFILAHEEIAKSAQNLIEYKECVEEIRFAAEDNTYEMLRYAAKIEEEYPYVACAWRTHRATIYILKNMKDFIEEMIDNYIVDHDDAEELLEEIDLKINETLSLHRYMKAKTGIKNCLKNVQWIKRERMIDSIMENTKTVSFSENQIIQESGKEHTDIKILYKGILQVSGTSTHEKSTVLPNTDSMRYFHTAGKFVVFMNSPQTLGLLGYLHRKPSVTSVTSMNKSQLISIPFEKLEEFEDQFGSLSFYMWRPIALQIALAVLYEEQNYENWSIRKLKIHLEEGIFPNFDYTVDFDVPSIIIDMVLIQGEVMDKETGCTFVGPDYIPSSVRSLMIMGDPDDRPRVVMVLLRESKYHGRTVMGWVNIEDVKQIGLCIIHGMRRMTSLSQQSLTDIPSRSRSFIQTLGSIFKLKEYTGS